ncbi:hypothetical protein JCM5353_003352 [Sporobolomyces roseus]
MDHLPTEVLQQIIFEIMHNSNSSSPQADLASFARITRRISSIATPDLYRSIHLVDGRSAQLLVRTYLDGINPFTLARGMDSPRVQIESPEFEYVKVNLQRGLPFHARVHKAFRKTYRKRVALPRLDILADYGFLSNLTILFLANFTDDLDIVPRLLGLRTPLRQQLKKLGLAHTENEECSIRHAFVLSFVLGAPAFLDPTEYLLDCPIITVADVFADNADEDYSDALDRISTPYPERPSPSLCRQACYDFDTYASLYNWSGTHGPLKLVQPSIKSLPAGIQLSRLDTLRVRLYSEEVLPLLLNKTVLPLLKTLVLICDSHYVESDRDVLLLRRTITRFEGEMSGTIIGPRTSRIVEMDRSAVFGVEDLWDDWPPLSEQQVKEFGDYRGVELDLLDLSEVHVEN